MYSTTEPPPCNPAWPTFEETFRELETERRRRIEALGLEKYWYSDHPEFKVSPNQPGTLRQQLDIVHGRQPAEPLPDAFMARFAAAAMSDPIAFGELCIQCAEEARSARKGGAA